MTTEMKHDIKKVGAQFKVEGKFQSASPYGSGHINDTYAAVYDKGGRNVRYILQRINHNIFKNTAGLMDNVKRVTEHQRDFLVRTGAKDLDRRALRLVPSRNGMHYLKDDEGNTWRVYDFIEGASTYDKIERIEHAYLAAKAFGEFQKQLVDMPGGRLVETIPDFHNTPKRFDAFKKAVEADVKGRAKSCRSEMEFVKRHEEMTGRLVGLQAKGIIPERVTHNDTKINNVMLDDKTGEGICVIDLDTVMPGLALYDFGDMVRTATNSAAEDENDLSKVFSRIEVFEALVKGYMEASGDFLNEAEVENLVLGGKMMTFEVGMRFLTDFLSGDVYFKTQRDNHNLDRARNQFKIVESITEQEAKFDRIVRKYAG
ncbi:MAG: mucin desulfatase [Verrucomicrobia bacterium]|nr:mucin desulfatase [Verrucomicrobiota bacterium]